MSKPRTLFLCKGNLCRSQITKGFIKHYLKKSLKAVSVGIKLSFEVRPLAVKAMAEVGIDTSNYKPKPLDEFRKKKVDLVVSVCNNADEECSV